MSSTNFTIGLNGNRPSSRVLRPPGGFSSDIFGGQVEPSTVRRLTPSAVGQVGELSKETSDTNKITTATQNYQESPLQEVEEIPHSVASKAEPTKVMAPKRVRYPPGGLSSGLW